MGATESRRSSPRRELMLAALLGVAGAGLVFLAVRQDWAHVRTAAPLPLPGGDSPVTGQDLVPAATALAVAVLASLAAVLATRGTARKLVGLTIAGFGAGLVAAVSLPVTAADAIAAVSGSAGSSAPAGSVTAGGVSAGRGPGGGAPPITGFHAHVVMTALPWHILAVAGGLAIIAAGLLVTWRGASWPVMSSRFDAPERGSPRAAARAPRPAPAAGDTATIWESLSRGEDPTAGGPG